MLLVLVGITKTVSCSFATLPFCLFWNILYIWIALNIFFNPDNRCFGFAVYLKQDAAAHFNQKSDNQLSTTATSQSKTICYNISVLYI